MKLLLLSNSTNAGEAYLEYPKNEIVSFLGKTPVTALFIPFAAVTFSFDEYEKKVSEKFSEIGHRVVSIHHSKSMVKAVKEAQVIIIGGGNTFQLLSLLQKHQLLDIIRERVLNGTPYIGWSAGSNVACPSICTTNDMPIVEPLNFKALNLVPFQINPHYTDIVPPNHAGETRDQRILEFLMANQDKKVLGLWEGTMLRLENQKLSLIGNKSARLFTFNHPLKELSYLNDLSFLLNE